MTQTFYTIVRLHKEDLEGYLSEKARERLTPEEMQHIADMMGEAIMNSGIFWDALQMALMDTPTHT